MESDFKFLDKYIKKSEEAIDTPICNVIDYNSLVETFIPSKTVKQYIYDNNWHFSDADWATIIYNSEYLHDYKLKVLSDLAKITSNENLKTEINERIAFDNEAFERFCDNEGCIYVVMLDDEIAAICNKASVAYEKGCQYGANFTIEKYHIITSATEGLTMRITDTFFSPIDMKVYEQKLAPNDNVPPLSAIRFDENGCVMSYWSSETNIEDAEKIEGNSPKRFEYIFIDVPNPFDEGDVVSIVGEKGAYYVMTSHIDWTIQNEKDKQRAIIDWSDASIVIQKSKEDPINHIHINPLYLERVK